jgi:hypothetical protein
MRTVGWVDPAAEVKENKLEQAEEPAPVLVEEPEAVEEAKEEKKPAKKAATKKK